jgi:two-component system cell cycle sensor histidine kinase/response regulator CckA
MRMKENNISLNIASLEQRVKDLQQYAAGGSDPAGESLLAPLEEMQQMLKELQLVREKLRLKNGELQAARQTAAEARALYQSLCECPMNGPAAPEAQEPPQECWANLPTLFNAVDDLLFILDLEGRILEVNLAAQQRLGYKAEELAGQSFGIVYPPERQAEAAAVFAGLAAGAAKSSPLSLLAKDGKLLDVEAKVTLGRWGHREVLFSICRDLTPRKLAEAHLRHREEQLRRAQKMEAIGHLAGGVAHDFNNLLMVIMGYIELALHALSEEDPLRKGAEQISKAATRGAALTQQLLAFSRRQELRPQILDLNTVVADMEKMLRRLIGEDIELVISLTSDLPRLRADQGQIEQILMNLAINARQAMPQGGKLLITTTPAALDETSCQNFPEARPGQYACLEVADTGVGIDKALLDRIFEPFFSTKGKGVGTGLGLATVYGIVKQHKGGIQVESEPGRGATFRIYFPTYTGKAVEKSEGALLLAEPLGQGERILLVEDDDAVRDFMTTVLKEHGYQLFPAASAAAALEIFQKETGNFHLVFCDVVLPDKSSLQLVEDLLAANPALRVLLTSGYTDQRAQWPLIRSRGLPFIQKPCNISDLLRALRTALGENL